METTKAEAMSATVESVREKNLCTACGTCAGVCPSGAVSMARSAADFLVPGVDAEKCTKCGLCLRACPGVGLPAAVTGKFNDIFHGEALGAWVGRAADEELWKNGQSGGAVSALLLYLLDKGLADGVFVNGFDAETKRPKVLLATDKQQLLAAQGSYYAQSDVAAHAIGPGAARKAAVVLGCQAEGIALARLHAKNLETPGYLVGLVCAGNHSGLIIDDLIGQSGLPRQSVSSFRFRDKSAGGWPGNVRVRGGEKSAVLEKGRRIALKDCYGNYRCQCCFDQMNLLSDVAVGDPWGLGDGRDRGGRSMLLARTEKGRELVESAIRDGYLTASPVAAGAVFAGQTVDSRLKPQFFACREICEREGLPFPSYEFTSGGPGLSGKKARLARETLRYKYAVQSMRTRREIDRAVHRMKRRTGLRAWPANLAALVRRALGKLRRLLKGKGASR